MSDDGARRLDPRVTVAVPTFNRRALAVETVRSALAQHGPPLEVVVADNASDDGTAEAMAAIGDPRVRVDRAAENRGPRWNVNRCFALGAGDYVAVLHDDDLLRPGMIAGLSQSLDADPAVGVAYCEYEVLAADGRVIAPHRGYLAPAGTVTGAEFVRRAVAAPSPIHQSAALVRREALAGHELDEADGGYWDMGLWLRIAAAGWSVHHVVDSLAAVRVHEATLSHAGGLYEAEASGEVMTETLEQIRESHRCRMRFLDTDRHVADAGHLRDEARRFTRDQLAAWAGASTRGRGLVSTVSALGRAAAVEPRFLLDRRARSVLARRSPGPRLDAG